MNIFDIIDLFPPEIIQFVRISSIIGFIVTAVLVINLNYILFSKIFKERIKRLWWLFLLLMIVPLMVILYVFNLLFAQGNGGVFS